MSWEDDKRWSDQYLPEIKKLIGLHLVGEPAIEEDRDRNTDLMVLTMHSIRIGCRMRRPHDEWKYKHQFTIRSKRTYNETELDKILAGWGDFLFYGWGHDRGQLGTWHIGKLSVFRSWYQDELAAGRTPGFAQPNKDGSSTFRVFNYAKLPPEFIFAKG